MIHHGSTATAGSRKLEKEKFVIMQKKTCKPECKIFKKKEREKILRNSNGEYQLRGARYMRWSTNENTKE